MSSCYPGPGALDQADLDVVLTLYDENFDFSANQTYSMPDTVMAAGDRKILLTGKFDQRILSQVESNLQALGYQKEPDPENNPPDMIVLVSKVATFNIDFYQFYSYWWDYWGWYPGWPGYGYPVGPGWGPWYPWGGTVISTYTTGSVIIEFIDPDEADVDEKRLPVIWTGGINGLLEGGDNFIEERLTRTIDQCFDQSPYLKR